MNNFNNDWHKKAIVLTSEGFRPSAIARHLNNAGFNVSYNTVKSYIYRHKKKKKQLDGQLKIVDAFNNAPEEYTIDIDSIKTAETKTDKVTVMQNYEPKTFERDYGGARVIQFGLIGDTHIGSKYAQLTYLNQFYNICAEHGICDVYHAGDITEGLKMRPGHEYELSDISADDMKDDVVKNYPRIEGITTHFITGNHDSSLMKHVGHDIGRSISLERPDMHYLGRDCAIINLTDKCTLELRHPWDGTSYANSYKAQKMVDAMESDTKPNILAIGHYHKAFYMFYRNIHVFEVGTFCAQTPFMRGKSIAAHVGGWIISVCLDEEGTVRSIIPEFIPFYSSIKEDYKNFPV